MASVCHGKHHGNCEGHDDENRAGETRSQSYRSVGSCSAGTQRDGTRSWLLACFVCTWTFTKLGSIILRQWQRTSRTEFSETPTRNGNSQRCMAESSQRGTTQESISIQKLTVSTFQTWRRSGLLETRKRQRHRNTHQRQDSWRRSGVGDEHGNRRGRWIPKTAEIIWILYTGRLIICAPEHLRYSSDRAQQLANMGQAQRLPWTHESLDGWLRKGQYESLPMIDTPDADDTYEDDEGLKADSSAAWEHETRQVKRKLEMQPSSSSSLAHPRDEAVLSQTVENTPKSVRKVFEQSIKTLTQE